MKKGVKRIQPELSGGWNLVADAQNGLALLLTARDMFKRAGSSSTLARVNYAIASARGAVRAASYRETRMQRARNGG